MANLALHKNISINGSFEFGICVVRVSFYMYTVQPSIAWLLYFMQKKQAEPTKNVA